MKGCMENITIFPGSREGTGAPNVWFSIKVFFSVDAVVLHGSDKQGDRMSPAAQKVAKRHINVHIRSQYLCISLLSFGGNSWCTVGVLEASD